MSNHRFSVSLVIVLVPALWTLPQAAGQILSSSTKKTVSAKGSSLTRTSDGHPDLQGVWTNSTLTPLERPAQFSSKPVLTEAEATAYEKDTTVQRNRDRRDGGADVDVGRAYNELFFDQGDKLAHIDGTIRTSMIVDPQDGHIPALTPEAQKRMEAVRDAVDALLHRVRNW